MEKFDVFVCSPKGTAETIYINIHVKLMRMFQARLRDHGFSNVRVDSMWHLTTPVLTDDELVILATNPMFISEHWLGKTVDLGGLQKEQIVRIFKAPWKMRPEIAEYHYVDRGKRPKLHTAFVGGFNSGKTWLMHEFIQMLKEIAPPMEIIKCAHPESDLGHWDVTTDPDFMQEYFDHIRDHGICLGNGPSFHVNLDYQLEHNTRI